MSSNKTPVTIAYGDGIGPEIMEATLRVLDAAGAAIEPEVITIGESLFQKGIASGIEESAWESLRRTKVFLKSPITTPQGGGFKSLNVTARTTLGLYANVRPCQAFSPYVRTNHPALDLVIIRENEEDLYTGIEYRQTNDVYECLKIISRPGSEKIIRYAFEYARANNRKKVTCMSKDNIMKMTDGLFHKVFNEIAEEYPEIEVDHWIIDIGSALIADRPERFDIIVTLNLYGDIISDIAAQVAGSVGMGGSSNIGDQCAMFEAIHGSAPDIAGKGVANPSGLLNGAIMMLTHIGQGDVAAKIHNAWLKTIEDGIHTGDIYKEGVSQKRVNTTEFANALIERLGQVPSHFKAVSYSNKAFEGTTSSVREAIKTKKELKGIDIFMDGGTEWNTESLSTSLEAISVDSLNLKSIYNRGVKVYPHGVPETFTTDHWRCRFLTDNNATVTSQNILALQALLLEKGFDVIKTENLYDFDGKPGYTKSSDE